MKVLAVDLDPQANLSQYFMGAKGYLAYLNENKGTVVEIFEQFTAPKPKKGSPRLVLPTPSSTHYMNGMMGAYSISYHRD